MSAVLPSFDLQSILAFLATVLEMSGSVSAFIQQYSVTVIQALPAESVLWFELSIYGAIAYGVAKLGEKVSKILTVIFVVMFIITVVKGTLHI